MEFGLNEFYITVPIPHICLWFIYVLLWFSDRAQTVYFSLQFGFEQASVLTPLNVLKQV